MKMDFEKPYPDEERMRRGLLYWQNSSQPHTEERCKEKGMIYPIHTHFLYS
jgi:hypothetical protein